MTYRFEHEDSESKPVPYRRVRFGRIHSHEATFQGAVQHISALASGRRASLVVTPNIAHVWQARGHNDLRAAYARSTFAPPDGWPLVLGIRLALGAGARVERVSGADLLPALCREGLSVAFVGGKGDSATQAADVLTAADTRLTVLSIETAPASELASVTKRQLLISRIAESKADIIFVGLGVPKQERLALELMDTLERGVVMCVGASIEFAAGTLSRAPIWVQRCKLEWLYRVYHEPRKLLVRYALSGPYFVGVLAQQVLSRKFFQRRSGEK